MNPQKNMVVRAREQSGDSKETSRSGTKSTARRKEGSLRSQNMKEERLKEPQLRASTKAEKIRKKQVVRAEGGAT